jgi:septal ring factor EnvC (AmiA/AmiB activator)
MAAGLEQLLISSAVTGGVGAAATWAALRGKRVETAGDVQVAAITAETTFAAELRQTVTLLGQTQANLSEERGKVQLLRFQLAAAVQENEKLAGEVAHLRTSLEESAVRLDDLNAQLTALSTAVARLIPTQAEPV